LKSVFFNEVSESMTELLKGPNKENQRIAIQAEYIQVFKNILEGYVGVSQEDYKDTE